MLVASGLGLVALLPLSLLVGWFRLHLKGMPSRRRRRLRRHASPQPSERSK